MNSTIFSRFLRALRGLRRRKLKQKIWKIYWFSMSLYEFKSSRCSPCNQSTQRRRKVYRCWVSSSPIKRAKYETCKYNVNHHGWAHHQGENQIHSFQCRNYLMDSSHHRCQISHVRQANYIVAKRTTKVAFTIHCWLTQPLRVHSRVLVHVPKFRERASTKGRRHEQEEFDMGSGPAATTARPHRVRWVTIRNQPLQTHASQGG